MGEVAVGYTYRVGEDAELWIGLGGKVEKVEDGFVTIGGYRLPTRLIKTERLETFWLSSADPDIDHEFCGDDDDDVGEYNRGRDSAHERWVALARAEHDEFHDGVMRFCQNALCREAVRRGP